MALFPKNPNESRYPGGKKHLTDVIKSEGGVGDLFYLNPQEDFNNGSVLIVEEGQVALFVRDGTIVQEFTPGRYVLETNNYPFISRLFNMASGGISSFHCTVVFVRMEDTAPIRWGTRTPIQLVDYQMGMPVDVRAFGSYVVRVTSAPTLYRKLVGASVKSMDASYIRQQLEDVVAEEIMASIATVMNAASQRGEAVFDLCSHVKDFTPSVSEAVGGVLESYGLALQRLNIGGMSVPPDSEYMRLVQRRAAQRVDITDRGIAQQQAMQAFAGTAPNAGWQAQQNVDIMGTMAANPAGEAAGAMAGIGLGLGAMQTIGTMAGQVANGMAAPAQAAPVGNPAPVAGTAPTGPRPQEAEQTQPTQQPTQPASQAPTQPMGQAAGMTTCPSCGGSIPAGSKFCMLCGAKIEAARFCPECGAKLQPGAKFCPQCGTRVQE